MTRAARMVLLAGLVAGATTPAFAQVFSWTSQSDGLWLTTTNWSPSGVPNNQTMHAALIGTGGTYTVSLTFSSCALNAFSLTNPNATLAIQNNANLTVGGTPSTPAGFTLGNAGTIRVNPAGGTGNGAFLSINTTGTLGGTGGQVVLNASASNLGTASLIAQGASATNAAGHTIRGTGRITGPWINEGIVSADVSGATLQLDGAPRTNNATMRAILGGTLTLQGDATTQGPLGRLIADGGTLNLNATTITGGSVEQLNSGTVSVQGNSTWTSVQPVGDIVLAPSATLTIASAGLDHQGTITINPTASATGAALQFNLPGTLSGSGAVVLNAAPTNASTAILGGNGIVHGPSRAIRGRGRISGNQTIQGTIAPGTPTAVAAIESVSGTLVLAPGSVTRIKLAGAGAGQFDVLSGTSKTLGGRLEVSLLNGFIPSAGDSFDIITGGVIAGTFSEVILPPLPGAPAGRQLAVTYLSDRVRLVACVANCDGSQIAPVLNAGDFNCFINRFRAATSLPPAGQIADYANCDNSTTPPVLNAGDFACFLTKFRAGCP